MVMQVGHEQERAHALRRETYSLRDFSTLTGLSMTAIRRGIREDDLPVPPIKIGGSWKFRRREVDRLVGIEDAD